jgi:hypothetical protein
MIRMGVIANLCVTATACILNATAADQHLPQAVESDVIEAVFHVNEGVYSGGEPKGTAAFEELRDLGVRTIISVDGAKPDLASARHVGLRHIHLPMSYGRWSRTNQLRLIVAAQQALRSGSLYVHCHHGRHRGPTAVALICRGLRGWNNDQSTNWLAIAGTGTNYTGLFENVKEFIRPGTGELGSIDDSFSECVEPGRLVETMVSMESTIERIELLLTHTNAHDHQHLAHESLLLLESLRELVRADAQAKQGPRFNAALKATLERAARLNEDAETARGVDAISTDLMALRESCTDCHQTFRDAP